MLDEKSNRDTKHIRIMLKLLSIKSLSVALMSLVYAVKGLVVDNNNNNNKGRKSPEEKDRERMLDCLSLGLCQLFGCLTPH
jgi:hypothetical protein